MLGGDVWRCGWLWLWVLLSIGCWLTNQSCQAQPTTLTWNEEHAHCSLTLPGHHHLSTHRFSKGGGSWHVKAPSSNYSSPHGRCTPHPYFTYFQRILHHLDTSSSAASDTHAAWYRGVAQEVLQLYAQLPQRRSPTVLSADYLQRHFPRYSELHASNPAAYPTTYVEVQPFVFGLPVENFRIAVAPKDKPFGRVVPGARDTYFSLMEEALYADDLARSQFVLTWKKAGWDCLRHYEILAQGALPLFTDIADAPREVLTVHPKALYQRLLQTPGLTVSLTLTKQQGVHRSFAVRELSYRPPAAAAAGVNQTQFLFHLSEALLVYAHQTMTTAAYARSFLATIRRNTQRWYPTQRLAEDWPRSVLYLTHKNSWDMDQGDYGTDFLLHGLLSLLGEFRAERRAGGGYRQLRGVLDFPSRDCLYKRDAHWQQATFYRQRAQQYGMGYSYGLHREALAHELVRNLSQVGELLRLPAAESFDLVVLGSVHREGWMSQLHLWDDVCRHVARSRVALLDADDSPLQKFRLAKFLPCAAHVFAREGYVVGVSDAK